jgi:oligopeptide transport system ATP-binding protein
MAGSDPILAVRDLRVRFRTLDGVVDAVKGVNLQVNAGETAAIVGESGSGKSQTMMAAMRLLASNGSATGTVDYRGRNLLELSKRELNRIRGSRISMIFQEPMTSLDPLYSIGSQLMEPIRRHRKLGAKEARAEAIRLLDLVRIPDPERRFKSYPYELSGGQRQRVMIAMALANNPDILIADEPTTALDVTVQAQILTLLAELQQKLGMAIVFITHDLGIVRRLADRVYVMRAGEVMEEGETGRIFAEPRHPYTKMLLSAEPSGRKEPPPSGSPVILEGRSVEVTFSIGGGFLSGPPMILRAVDKVSLALKQKQTIGIVGESGSGKSTLGRALLRLLPSEGVIRLGVKDISKADREAMQPLRRELQLVFQDPFGSLSPRMTVGQIVTEGLLVHEQSLSRAERDRRAAEALREVGLDPAMRNRYPHEFSGGQRQRIAIARAMILKPRVVVLDEPTSALDRSVQKQIVELLRNLQSTHELSYLFISHDLAVVRAMADYIMVMRQGRVVEQGPTDEIFDSPREEYTRTLMAAAVDEKRFRAGTLEPVAQENETRQGQEPGLESKSIWNG